MQPCFFLITLTLTVHPSNSTARGASSRGGQTLPLPRRFNSPRLQKGVFGDGLRGWQSLWTEPNNASWTDSKCHLMADDDIGPRHWMIAPPGPYCGVHTPCVRRPPAASPRPQRAWTIAQRFAAHLFPERSRDGKRLACVCGVTWVWVATGCLKAECGGCYKKRSW